MRTAMPSRFVGAIMGMAVGDAVGTTVEFSRPGSFDPVTDMVGGGPFRLKVGEWTDDTSMALCLAESLVECGGFDPVDQMSRYVRWFRDGYWSSNGVCFDIGNTTSAALVAFERGGEPFSGPTERHTAGNGSVMRLASVPLFYADRPERAVRLAGESSRTTHGAPQSVDGCRYFGGLIAMAARGATKAELLADRATPAGAWGDHAPWDPEIEEVAAGSFKRREPPEITGAGYVVRTIEAVLWAFYRSDSFAEGLLKVVNLGDDADTTGAVYGQLAGCFYGRDGVPSKWADRIARREEILELAERLHDAATASEGSE